MRRCRISGISSKSSSPQRLCGQEGRTWAAEARSGRCRAGRSIPISRCPQTPAERQNPGWRGPIAPSHRWRHCCKTEKCRTEYSCRTAAAACRIKGSGFPPIETSRLIYGASALSVIFRFPHRNSGFPPNHDNPFCMGICDRTLPAVY